MIFSKQMGPVSVMFASSHHKSLLLCLLLLPSAPPPSLPHPEQLPGLLDKVVTAHQGMVTQTHEKLMGFSGLGSNPGFATSELLDLVNVI